MDNKNNLELWDKVSITSTDEWVTKKVSYWTKKFTAIDAYHQIKDATEQWGTYGKDWGFEEVKYEFHDWMVFFQASFYYPKWNFPIISDNKIENDCMKKVYTDSLTKALSYLGWNADIFMGQFDGNKYTEKKQDTLSEIESNDPWLKEINKTDTKQCECWVNMIAKSWTSKTGRPYSGWVCVNWIKEHNIWNK